MNIAIQNVLNGLRNGNMTSAYEYKGYLNDVAMTLYNKPQLTAEDIEDLKGIITICNITYNDTDKELLPIEDGFYDLLLEKYKIYDHNFQVGAEVIDFKSSNGNNKVYAEQQMIPAITFEEPVDDKEYFFLNDLVIPDTKFIDRRDFENKSVPISADYITKRYHDTQHNHPELVGTLDKCKFVLDKDAAERGVLDDSNVKTVERDFFQDHLLRGIIQPNQKFDIILELKYDGISVEADCTDEVISARSRGDTGVGRAADLTPILKGYKFPHREKNAPMIGVKFEAIITQYDLPYFNAAKGYEYKNCRSAIVGLFASGDAWKFRDFITLVPLAVESEVYHTTCHSDRLQEIKYLNDNFVSKGCPLRWAMASGTYIENLVWINIFTKNAEMLRSRIPFMYDGIVFSYRDEAIRQKLGRENYINKYSMAVKFNPLRKQTIFRGYSYTVGQDGSITPMIHYDPVEFYGTIHPKSSGQSLARFNELQLHKGDMIDVEYVNDVMPYVSKPINDWNIDNEKVSPLEVFPNICPICGGPVQVSDSGRSAKCINPDCGGRQLARMVNMCAKLGLIGFGEATINQIGAYHLKELLEITTGTNWLQNLQSKGFGPIESDNIHSQCMNLLTQPLMDSVLLGSIGFTSISTKTWELILPELNYQKIRDMFNMLDPSGFYRKRVIEHMSSIKGIGPTTANTIGREWDYFKNDLEYMFTHGNITKYKRIEGKKIRFTGFRDKELEVYLKSLGFDADQDAPVNKDCYALLVPNTSINTTKTRKAERFGVMIVPKDDFVANLDKYMK